MRAGQALAAIAGPTASGQAATTSAIAPGGPRRASSRRSSAPIGSRPAHAASATLGVALASHGDHERRLRRPGGSAAAEVALITV